MSGADEGIDKLAMEAVNGFKLFFGTPPGLKFCGIPVYVNNFLAITNPRRKPHRRPRRLARAIASPPRGKP